MVAVILTSEICHHPEADLSLVVRKPVFRSDKNRAQHKPGCAVTEDGERLDILYLRSRGIVLAM